MEKALRNDESVFVPVSIRSLLWHQVFLSAKEFLERECVNNGEAHEAEQPLRCE